MAVVPHLRPPQQRKQRASASQLVVLCSVVLMTAMVWFRGSLSRPVSMVSTSAGSVELRPAAATAASASGAAAGADSGAAQQAATADAAGAGGAAAAGAGFKRPFLPGINDARTEKFKTGVFYTVKKDDTSPEERFELLDEPVPQDCYMEAMADYDGPSLTWGLNYKAQSARQCCEACKKFPAGEHRCDIWVYCGSKTGACWSPDIWNHTTGECWLKYQTEWDGEIERSATNLKVNHRGRYEPDYRREHTTAPQAVQWTAGLILRP